jgi:hypothetical protein
MDGRCKALLLLSIVASSLSAMIVRTSKVDAATGTLISSLTTLVDTNVNWLRDNMLTREAAYSFGKITKDQLAAWILTLNTPSWAPHVFECYVRVQKYGIENQTQIQWALDSVTMLANGLPERYGTNYFAVNDRFILQGYYWAQKYSYDLAKWNLTDAYANFAWAIDHSTYPAISTVYGDNTTALSVGYGPRYYDEAAQTMDCFLTLYQLGVNEALAEAQKTWNWTNTNLWASDHYNYALQWAGWECESGGFFEIAMKLKYYAPQTADITRATTDMVNRYLANSWGSPQWLAGAVIHKYPGILQRRLASTIMAWNSLYGNYYNLADEQRINMTKLLTGYGADAAAWRKLFDESGLYNATAGLFKPYSDSSSPNMDYSAWACCLLRTYGIVPGTGALAMPVTEYEYEDPAAMFDADLFGMNINARTLKLAIMVPGTISFQYGSDTVTYDFTQPGLFNVQFGSDWNSINTATRMGDLPSRLYFGNVPTPDTTPPTYDNSTLKASNVLAGSMCTFSCRWQDDVGLSGFIFEHNNTGTLKNETWTSFDAAGSNSQWSNASLTLNDTANTFIQWKFYANDTNNNWNHDMPLQYLTIRQGMHGHEIAVINVVSPKTVVGQGFSLGISVTVANLGDYPETFNVTVYANSSSIASQNMTLTSGSSNVIIAIWDTSGFAKGNYAIHAYAWPVLGETNTTDNNFTGGWFVVSMVGDLTGAPGHSVWDFVPDGYVDGSDLIAVAMCFGSWPGAPPPYRWNANCDITNDGSIDGADLIMIARHFGQTSP